MPDHRQALKPFIFSLIPALALFLIFEFVLRGIGFKYAETPLEMREIETRRSGPVQSVLNWNNQDGVIRFKKDARQFWVPAHSFEQDHRVVKEPGVIRIATLGCSCTQGCQGTDQTYPGLMEALLNAKQPKKVEVLNAGVGSYTSFQGLARLQHVVLKYHPDLLTVFFGWNDHWISPIPDKEVRIRSERVTTVLNFTEQFRVYQFLNFVIRKKRPTLEEKSWTLRVLPEDYRDNLTAMIEMAEAHGIKVLLITAPHDLSHFEPNDNFPYPKEKLIPLHEQYNQVVRRVAEERRVPLLDLEKLVREGAGEPLLSGDGIHFNPAGCRFVAEALADKILSEALSS